MEEEEQSFADTNEILDNTVCPVLPSEIQKEILVAAPDTETKYPTKGDDVFVHYVGTLASDGSKFDSSRDRKDPFKFKLGMGQVIKGWDLGVATMRKGEKAIFTLPSQYAYGASGSPPKIPGDATLKFEVELLSFGSDLDLFMDGGVIKSVVRKSSQFKKPKVGDEVVFAFNAGSPILYTIGDPSSLVDMFLPTEVLDKFLTDMKLEESSCINITNEKYSVDGNLLKGEITLLEIRSIDDCSFEIGSKIVWKKTLKKGDSYDCPNEFSTVKAEISITNKVTKGVIISKTVVNVVPGTGQHSEALESTLVRIVPNEEVVVHTTVDDAWIDSALGIGPLPAAETEMHVKLIEFTKATDSWQLKGAEKLARLTVLKNAGGEVFKSGRVRFALNRYCAAIRMYEHDKSVPSADSALVRMCLLNEAMCQLKLGEFRKAEVAATKVIKDEPSNVKALYRRAQALAKLEEFQMALVDAKRVVELDVANADARTLLTSLKTQVKKNNDAMKGLYSKMFS